MNKNLNLNPAVCHIQYAPISDVKTVLISQKKCKVIFNQGKDWIDFYATPGKIGFEFPQDNIEGNNIFKTKVSISFPGLDEKNVSDLFNADALLYIVKVSMNSGEEYVVGSKENPAQYLESFSTGNSGRSINFWCDAVERPYPYQI
jgi:hypothetical protein